MKPWVSGRQTFLATFNRLGKPGDPNLIEVGAGGHRFSLAHRRLMGGKSVLQPLLVG
jgi:hypothetical protein